MSPFLSLVGNPEQEPSPRTHSIYAFMPGGTSVSRSRTHSCRRGKHLHQYSIREQMPDREKEGLCPLLGKNARLRSSAGTITLESSKEVSGSPPSGSPGESRWRSIF